MLLRRLARLLSALPVAASLAAPGLVAPTTAAAAATGVPTFVQPTWSVHVSGPHAVTGIDEPYSTPAVGDLNGDGGLEVVAGFLDGTVRAYNALNGQQLWVRQTGGEIDGSPTLASLSGDGRLEVIVTSRSGYINVYNPDGSNFPGWPVFPSSIGNWTPNFGSGRFFASAAVGDLFGDSRLEVVTAGWDHRLYAFNAYGQILPGFPKNLWDTVWDTPLLVDLEGHGQRDIVIGSDSNDGTEPYGKGGVWWAFRPDGSQIPGWPQSPPFLNPRALASQNEVPWSSPAAAALTPGGPTSVVTGTGHYFAQTLNNPSLGTYDNVYTTAGVERFGHALPTQSQNFSSPAIGDLLNRGDGSREIVQISERTTTGQPAAVYAWDGSGNLLPGWPVSPPNGTDLGSPVIAPVGGICGSGNGVWIPGYFSVLGYCSNGVLAVNIATGAPQANNPYPTAAPMSAAPTIADLGNGHLSLVALYQTNDVNYSTDWQLTVWPLAGTTTMPAGAWPTFHGSMLRNGTAAVAPNHNQNVAFVKNLYHDILGRTTAPSASELNFWVHRLDNGAERYWVASSFVVSTEFHSTIVTNDYHQMFNSSRNPDPGGLAFWVGQLNAGVHNERLLGQIGGSDEFFLDNGSNFPQLVNALYQHILNRTPAPGDPGPAYWIGQLNNGLPRGVIGDVFANSHEYHMDVVASWYWTFLGRGPDANGQSFWAGYLDRGNSDDAGIVSIISSDEYYNHSAPAGW
jgi:hypothetical protein